MQGMKVSRFSIRVEVAAELEKASLLLAYHTHTYMPYTIFAIWPAAWLACELAGSFCMVMARYSCRGSSSKASKRESHSAVRLCVDGVCVCVPSSFYIVRSLARSLARTYDRRNIVDMANVVASCILSFVSFVVYRVGVVVRCIFIARGKEKTERGKRRGERKRERKKERGKERKREAAVGTVFSYCTVRIHVAFHSRSISFCFQVWLPACLVSLTR